MTGEIGAGADEVLFTGGSVGQFGFNLPDFFGLHEWRKTRDSFSLFRVGTEVVSYFRAGVRGSDRLSHHVCDWKFRVVGDLFKVVIL